MMETGAVVFVIGIAGACFPRFGFLLIGVLGFLMMGIQ